MRRLIAILSLEGYAVLLALHHWSGHVVTDEAKYLLNVPYPHPPLIRFLLGTFLHLPFQELFFRLLFSTLLVQAVWLFWPIIMRFPPVKRFAVMLFWVFSVAVIQQAGAVLMAPITALYACVWVVLVVRPVAPSKSATPLIGCLWFASLFSAYQGVLYLPLVFCLLKSARASWREMLAYLFLPLFLLCLYTASNPVVAANFLLTAGKDAHLTFGTRLSELLNVWFMGGGVVVSILGTWGIVTSGRRELLVTFLLVTAYVALVNYSYYAILFTPLFLAGTYIFFQSKRRIPVAQLLLVHVISSAVVAYVTFPWVLPTTAHEVMQGLQERGIDRPVLIDGFFGHDWQYESAVPVLRFTQTLSTEIERSAGAFVCTKLHCEDDVDLEQWVPVSGLPLPVWEKRTADQTP